MGENRLMADIFLPLDGSDPVDPHSFPYKIRMKWNKAAYDWLYQELKFDTSWFSMIDDEHGDYEHYYFCNKSDAVRFWITWA